MFQKKVLYSNSNLEFQSENPVKLTKSSNKDQSMFGLQFTT